MLVAHPGAELYGSDRVLAQSVAALADAGCEVTVALPGYGPLVAHLERCGARVVTCPSPVVRRSVARPRGALAFAAAAARAVPAGLALLRSTRADVVLVNTVTVPLWLVLARLARRPAIVHVHEAEGSAHPLVRRALAAPLRLADAVLVNSAFAREVLLGAVPALGGRTTLLLNAVPGPLAAPLPARDEPVGGVRLVCVGRLSPRKGVAVALEALALLLARGVDARLELVGDVFEGYGWFSAALRERAARPDLVGRVSFAGAVEDVWPHLAAADVALVPSTGDEPFGNTAVEAVLAARPLVVSDTTGLREAAAGYGCAVAVVPDDAAALADGVQAVLDGWPQRRAAALDDARTAAARHDPARYAEHLVAAVTALARDAPGPGRPGPGARASGAGDLPPTGRSPGPVVVAVLTYRRPAELAALLPELVAQAASLEPPAQVLVVDNDPDAAAVHAADPHGSPRAVVAAAGGGAAPAVVRYAWQPRPGIAAARNEALERAAADGAGALVFVDDDEHPVPGWLEALVSTWADTGAGAVVGPVVSSFEGEVDPWVVAGGFFERRRPPTGARVDVAATNNLLLDLAVVASAGLVFDERFGLSGGSDTLFTRRLHAAGAEMVWCDEALVTDRVPAARTTRRWVLARALRSGNSWSRTSLALLRGSSSGPLSGPSSGPARVRGARVRGDLLARGGVRALGGGARLVAGTALRAAGRGPEQQARGARTLARGAGMVGGALGWTYVEYRRRS